MPTIPIPKVASDITAEWADTVLTHAGYDVAISEVAVSPIGTGQMADSLRVVPDYSSVTPSAPSTFVVKMASNDPNSRAAGQRGAYLKEVRFYERLSAQLGVATPQSLWSDIDLETSDFAIVLEDMAPAVQGDQIIGGDADSIEAAAINIAGLHAPFWCDEKLHEYAWLSPPLDQREASVRDLKAILTMVTPGFIDRYRNRIDDHHIDLLNWFADTVDTWIQDDRGRFALMHGDHRLDNLLFNAADPIRPVTVVDWQTLAVRNPMADISYLLGTGLDAQTRRRVEHDIVARYHEQLVTLGIDNYAQSECFDDYRTQSPHALLLTVLGSMLTVQTDRGDDMFMAMLHRSSNQIFDLDIR